jgi:hypothetical protein
MHIDGYAFGKMEIGNQTFTSDVIVYPDRVDASWWRKEGHYLQKEDLSDVIAEKPDVLIIGTGNMGVMQVPEGTVRFLEVQGIEVHIEKTGKAVELFNSRPAGKKVIGAFHLTC